MKKALRLAAVLGLMSLGWCTDVHAGGKLVTPDVPLTSSYYGYIDKMEGMGFITDMPSSTRPYSRLEMARLVAKVNPEGMQPYMRVWYDELCDALSDEIAYLIVHRPLVQEYKLAKAPHQKTKTIRLNRKSAKRANNGVANANNSVAIANGGQVAYNNAGNTANANNSVGNANSMTIDPQHVQRYYADKYNWLVAEKVKLAGPKHFPSNVALRSASVELSYEQQDQRDYKYKKMNASYQPLHGDNSGYRYGEGANLVGELNVSGSLSNDVAMSVTPRFSWDKDQKGDASLREGYVRTHLGVWSLTVGKQQINWASHLGSAGQSVSSNASAQNMVRLGFLEPQETKDWGFLKLLGKIDFHAFCALQEGNRREQYLKWHPTGNPEDETNHLKFMGARLEIQPTDTFTIGLERMTHMKKFGKNWLMMKNDGIDEEGNDYGNDQNGVDWRWKLPGVQFYGAWHGEDGDREVTDLFTTGRSRRYGLYFPQLAKDGSWDLQVERTWNYGEVYWYQHGRPDGNGWEYGYDIMGDSMGGDADKYRAIINHYRRNGDILRFTYQNTTWDKEDKASPNFKEFKVGYEHKLRENLHLGATVGYARIKNANYSSGRNESAKYVALRLNWRL